ncbi:hypothetical protein TSACC_2470 [Terrimicrobium sacchariphilum]|jgi:hypothetical protein|uniref:DUF4126 domain-containing protein n=1 Tax=Terrimicrobium sacchariphilum TaxID=690879 RepID=A0A146G3M1_TERSA|nr:DUF4126 domain-containing protein [Terrimicrobium sacchariphilum]GAT32073.1 hypothetical protein TSACC_2470 [Terrimicrobium sacchariphilum]
MEDVLQTLGVALGLAALAGLNLYLTVFAAGLAIHFSWVALPASLQSLHVLGDPWVIVVAGILYFLEFWADKVPWIDSANDSVHTIIRPIGGALLAVLALGDAHPTVKVVAALLAGGVTLSAHAAKAGARLVANTSPEPISNIGLSLGEDAVVLGGLTLVAWYPIVALIVTVAAIVVIWVVLPKLMRSVRATSWLAWRKLNEPAEGGDDDNIFRKIPGPCELLLRRAHATTEGFTVAVPCISGGGPRLPRNVFGWLIRFEGGRLFFVGPRRFGPIVVEIGLEGRDILRESRFLSERLLISGPSTTNVFLFERGHRVLCDRLADALKPLPAVEPELIP